MDCDLQDELCVWGCPRVWEARAQEGIVHRQPRLNCSFVPDYGSVTALLYILSYA